MNYSVPVSKMSVPRVGILYLLLLAHSTQASLLLPKIEESRRARVMEKNLLGPLLEGPPNTWIALFETDSHCLYYKTPEPPKKGSLIWAKNGCMSFKDLAVVERLQGIGNLSLRYEREDGHKTLKLRYTHDGIPKRRRYKLLNLSSDPSSPYSFFNLKRKTSFIGDAGDNYRDGTAKTCHRVDRNCNDTLENTCHLCRYGYFEVIDHPCPQGGSKFCGQDRCGEKGQPACILGLSRLHATFRRQPCQDYSPAGSCLSELQSSCDENGILVCL